MYIGSTDTRGLMHCLWEIIDNSVDEALGGFCTTIDVTLHPDGSAEVHDDGRGIPVDKEPKTGLSGVEVVFTKLHAGGKFGGGSYNATGGLHGVGSSVVNALSARLDVEVDRGPATQQDRKSTRLNSSHANISYAVFCLKKKKKTLPHRARWYAGSWIETTENSPSTHSGE